MSLDAARAKARGGELHYTPPIGYLWDRGAGIMFDPDMRNQEVIGPILTRCQELGSAGQVLLSMADQGIHFCKTRSNTGPQKRLHFAVVAE